MNARNRRYFEEDEAEEEGELDEQLLYEALAQRALRLRVEIVCSPSGVSPRKSLLQLSARRRDRLGRAHERGRSSDVRE